MAKLNVNGSVREFQAEGDWRLLVLFQRLFPGKPHTPRKRRRAGYARAT